MTALDLTQMREYLKRNRAVLLVLALGAFLMLLPGGDDRETREKETAFAEEEEKLAGALSRIEGAGECCVLYRQSSAAEKGGVVVVCEGADSAAVRLRITQAVGTYTGLGSDRITILKSQQGGI